LGQTWGASSIMPRAMAPLPCHRAHPSGTFAKPATSDLWQPLGQPSPLAADEPNYWQEGRMEFSVRMPNLIKSPPELDQFPMPLRSALHFLVALDVPEQGMSWGAPVLGAASEDRLTLVLDLDETLAHCRLEPLSAPRHSFCVRFEESKATGYVYVRPFARLFLEIVSRLFEVVVFTASSQSYADQVLNRLDPEGRFISTRLYRQHCTEVCGSFLKDMCRLGRPLERVVLVDNSPVSIVLCPDNGIIVSSWTAEGDDDRELMELLLLLQQCEVQTSVQDFLTRRYGIRAFFDTLRRRPELLGHEDF